MFFVAVMCFLMIASCQAQIPKASPCYESRIKLPDFNPSGILGQWYGYAAYPNCDPPGRCRRTEFIDDHAGTTIAVVKQLSTEPDTFQIYENVNFLRYNGNASYVVTKSSENPRYVGQHLEIWATDYTSYLYKGGCINVGDASLHYVWVLTRSPNPSPSVIAEIIEVLEIEGASMEYLLTFNQTDCLFEY